MNEQAELTRITSLSGSAAVKARIDCFIQPVSGPPKNVQGWWLPASDEHFEHYFQSVYSPEYFELLKGGRPAYQPKSQWKAIKNFGLLRGRRLAVDIGAHVGLWSAVLATQFSRVIAFEPIAENRACLSLNAPTVEVMPYALSDEVGVISLTNPEPTNSGAWTLGRGLVVGCLALDDFKGLEPDFVKIDVQAGVMEVLEGARQTFARSKPMVALEGTDGEHEFLIGMGLREVWRQNRDGVYVHGD